VGVHGSAYVVNVFFDLDGTLVDASDRLFRLFQFLVPASSFTKDDYWKLKRDKVSHRQILKEHFNFEIGQIDSFENTWLSMIELPEWIAYDRPFDQVTTYLKEVQKTHKVYVVTSRQFEKTATAQIHSYGWADIFADILVTGHRVAKADLVVKNVGITNADWFVGDTGKDIETGKQLGLRTAAVACGFLNKERLAEYNPDVIVRSVSELKLDN